MICRARLDCRRSALQLHSSRWHGTTADGKGLIRNHRLREVVARKSDRVLLARITPRWRCRRPLSRFRFGVASQTPAACTLHTVGGAVSECHAGACGGGIGGLAARPCGCARGDWAVFRRACGRAGGQAGRPTGGY